MEDEIESSAPAGEPEDATPLKDAGSEPEPQAEEDPFAAAFERATARVEAEASSAPAVPEPTEPSSDSQDDANPPEPPATPPARDPLEEFRARLKEGKGPQTQAEREIAETFAARARAEAEKAQRDIEFRDAYLQLLAQAEEDPAAWAEMIKADLKEGQKIVKFMNDFHEAYPDVSLEHPDAPVINRQEVHRQAAEQAFEVFDRGMVEAVKPFGLTEDDLAEVFEKSDRGLVDYTVKAIEEAVNREVAKRVSAELPKLLAEERKAIRLEEQAKMVRRSVVAPRSIAGRATGSDARQDAPKDPWLAAVQRAERKLEEAG